jgi:hypothetical protein
MFKFEKKLVVERKLGLFAAGLLKVFNKLQIVPNFKTDIDFSKLILPLDALFHLIR